MVSVSNDSGSVAGNEVIFEPSNTNRLQTINLHSTGTEHPMMRRVLLIDDEINVLHALQRTIRQCGLGQDMQ